MALYTQWAMHVWPYTPMRGTRNAALAAQSTEDEANELAMNATHSFIKMYAERC